LLVEQAARPGIAGSGRDKAAVSDQRGPGTIPRLCRKSPKWLSLPVSTIRAEAAKAS
jgi:hypothetical protein